MEEARNFAIKLLQNTNTNTMHADLNLLITKGLQNMVTIGQNAQIYPDKFVLRHF